MKTMIGASKLTEEQVKEIKVLFQTTTLNDGDIAKMFKVSRPFINLIRNGKRWNEEQRSFIMKQTTDEDTKTKEEQPQKTKG